MWNLGRDVCFPKRAGDAHLAICAIDCVHVANLRRIIIQRSQYMCVGLCTRCRASLVQQQVHRTQSTIVRYKVASCPFSLLPLLLLQVADKCGVIGLIQSKSYLPQPEAGS